MAKVEKPKQDMGTGSVKKLMVQMAVPALVGQVVNLLYNIVDRIYIGHIPEIGGAALTGVGLFTPILMLITAFAMMAGSGGAPRAAIAMGQGDKDKAEKILGNCFTVLMCFAVVLTIVFYFACHIVAYRYCKTYCSISIKSAFFCNKCVVQNLTLTL